MTQRKNHMSKTFPILVPKDNFEDYGIARGSAIIAIEALNEHPQSGIHKIYYEGNINGASNLEDFSDKCYLAASRGALKYPTVAFTVRNIADFEVVGHYDYENKKVNITNNQLLDEWQDLNELDSYMSP